MDGVAPVERAPLPDAEAGEEWVIRDGDIAAETLGDSRHGRVERDDRVAQRGDAALRRHAAAWTRGLRRLHAREVPEIDHEHRREPLRERRAGGPESAGR